MAKDLDPHKLSTPRIFLVRMLVFLILCGLVLFVLHKQIITAFMANPGLNALIIAVLFIGILLALPIPFTNYVFGGMLIAFAFALVERDGALLLVVWMTTIVIVIASATFSRALAGLFRDLL